MKTRFLLFFLLFGTAARTLPMQFPDEMILRDSEIEDVFRSFLKPILSFRKERLPVFFLVSSPIPNACATGDGMVFINTGLILSAESADELAGVLLHEWGHILFHHCVKMKEALRGAHYDGLLYTLLGAAAAGLSGSLEALPAALSLWPTIAMTTLSRYSQTQEASADQFCFSMLKKLRWPTRGTMNFHQRMGRAERFSRDSCVCFRTHPTSFERAEAARATRVGSAETLPEDAMPLPLVRAFERVKVKVTAFSSPLERVLEAVEGLNVSAPLKDYGRAIAFFRLGRAKEALKAISAFIRMIPESEAFGQELRAQILFYEGNLDQAILAMKRALYLRPGDRIFAALCAQMQTETRKPHHLKQAIRALEFILFTTAQHPADPELWYWLGKAYGKMGKQGRMRVCLAEYALAQKKTEEATFHIRKALSVLSANDAYLWRAKSIQNMLEDLKNKSRPIFDFGETE